MAIARTAPRIPRFLLNDGARGLVRRDQGSAQGGFRDMASAGMAHLYYGVAQSLVTPSLDQPGMTPKEASISSAKRNPVVLAPIWTIAFRMGAIPIKVFRFVQTPARPLLPPGVPPATTLPNAPEEGGDQEEQMEASPGRKDRMEAFDHPATKLLRRPNPVLTRNLMISGTVVGLFSTRGVGWLKERRDNTPFVFDPFTGDVLEGTGHSSDPRANPVQALWPIPANVLWPIRDPQKLIRGYEIRVPGFPATYVPFEDMCYFRLVPDIEDWAAGMAPLQALSDTAAWAQTTVQRMEQMIREAILQRFVIGIPDMDEASEQNLAARFARARSHVGEAPMVPDDVTIKNLGDALNPDVIVKSLDSARDLVKYVFGMPDPANRQDFYGDVVAPIADAMEQEMERSLLSEYPDDEAFPEFQFRQILAGDPAQRAQLHRERIYSAQETPNEARAEENRPPMVGGDLLMGPLNLVPIPEQGFGSPRVFPESQAAEQASAGGFGGAQGQGTLAGGRLETGGPNTPPGRTGPRGGGSMSGLATGSSSGRVMGGASPGFSGLRGTEEWQTFRDRVVGPQSLALTRRLRGLMRQEIARSQEPDPYWPEIVARTDHQVAELVWTFMTQAAQESYRAARTEAGADAGVPSSLPDELVARFRARADEMARAFGERRLQATFDEPDVMRVAWEQFRDMFSSGIAEAACSESFDAAADYAWAAMDAGAQAVLVPNGDVVNTSGGKEA